MAAPFQPAPPPARKTKEELESKKKGKKRKSAALLAMDSVLPDFMRDVKKEETDKENDYEAKMHVIERPATHMLIKDLLEMDVGKGESWEPQGFPPLTLNTANTTLQYSSTLQAWRDHRLQIWMWSRSTVMLREQQLLIYD